MKLLTPHLLKFAAFAAVLTLVFRYFLSIGIDKHSTIVIVITSVVYGIFMFVSGFYFGRKDAEYLPIFDIGFRSHAATYIVHIGVSLLWVGLGFASEYEKLSSTLSVALFWGVVLLVHFVFFLFTRKSAIKNLNKNDIFE